MNRFAFLFLILLGSVCYASTVDYTGIYDSYNLEAQKKYGDAIAKMTEIYSKNSDDYFVNYRLGWLFSLDQKYKNSVDHYKRAAINNPTSVEPWLALSSLMVNLADWKSALGYSEELIKRDSKSYYGHLRFILSNIRLKSYDAALEKVEAALKLYPTDPVFLEQKAFALAESGKVELARKVVSELIIISPSNVYAKTFLSAHKE
jgi:tetratricopeptide (TPR) repeat protein